MPTLGVGIYATLAVVNSSTLLSDKDGIAIVTALNIILPTFCSNWNIPRITVTYIARGKKTIMPLRCVLLDNSDVEHALGYHDQTSDIPYARVFVSTILQNNGVALYSPTPSVPTVAGTVSHEIFELLVDFRANVWWSSLDYSTFYAAEVCDPVEGNVVVVESKGQPKVGLSDWILPAWADPMARVGPYNHNNTLKAPFTLDKGGYMITLVNGTITQELGEDMKKGDSATSKPLCMRSRRRELAKK